MNLNFIAEVSPHYTTEGTVLMKPNNVTSKCNMLKCILFNQQNEFNDQIWSLNSIFLVK